MRQRFSEIKEPKAVLQAILPQLGWISLLAASNLAQNVGQVSGFVGAACGFGVEIAR